MGSEQQTKSGTEAAIAAAIAGQSIGERYDFIEDDVPIALDREQRVFVVKELLETIDRRAARPRRLQGTATHVELDSFVAGVNRFKDATSVVFADPANMKLLAVLNYHASAGVPAWSDHLHAYTCPRSKQWVTWTENEDDPLSPEEFADLIDENLEDLTSGESGAGYPKPLDLVELGRDLRIHTKGTFERKVDPRTGAFALVNRLDMETSSTTIPRAFLLAIPVFEGGMLYKVEARLKLRVLEGRPVLSFTLHRKLEIERDAFGDIRKVVAERCELPIFAGAPER